MRAWLFGLLVVAGCWVSSPPESPLAGAPSAYLRAHANQPVQWRLWGPEVQEEARRTGKPLFVSVGYLACHWCHVMAEESFADAEVAAELNANFIPVKVDREASPVLDAKLLVVTQAMTGRAGWPNNVVLSPAGEPLFAASYLPARDGERAGLPGLLGRLQAVGAAYRAGGAAAALSLGRAAREAAVGPSVDGALRVAGRRALGLADLELGGVGRGPKFPHVGVLALWAALGAEAEVAAGERALRYGAVTDPVLGGFRRYTVDRAWTKPHYERMLSDQAEVSLHLLGQVGDAEARRIALEALAAARTRLRRADGLYGAGLDAQWPGQGEGGPEVVAADALAARCPLVNEALWVGAEGPPMLAGPDAVGAPGVAECLAGLRQAWLAVGGPALDELPVLAYQARIALALWESGEPEWQAEALGLAERLHAVAPAAMGRVVGDLRSEPAALEDLAALAVLDLRLAEGTLDGRWLARGRAVLAQTERYEDELGLWREVGGTEAFLYRAKPWPESQAPGGATLLYEALWRLAALTGDAAARVRAERVAGLIAGAAEQEVMDVPFGVAMLLVAPRAREIVLSLPAGEAAGPWLAGLALEALDTVLVQRDAGPGWALTEGKGPGESGRAFVCERGLCQAPVGEPEALRAALSAR